MGNAFRHPGFLTYSQSSSPFISQGDSGRVWKDAASHDEAVSAILFADGSAYYGPERNGKPHGFGILIASEGSEVEGYWQSGLLEGSALRITPDGSECLRDYHRGQVTGELKVSTSQIARAGGRKMVRAISGLARGTKSESSSRSSMTPSSSSDDIHKVSRDMPFGTRTRLMAASHTPPPMYTSTGSSTARIYIPRPPSQVDTWLIPFDQLVFENRLSKHRCSHCSVVYKGSWLGKDVIIRVFTAGSIDDDRCRVLLAKMAKIRHPNIALFMAAAVSTPDNKLAIVTEYIVNGSLESIGKPWGASSSQTMTAQNILHLAKGIAVGCAYLRKQGFAHKNLKPSNVLIDSTIDIKLTDYFVKEFNELFHPLPCTSNISVSYLAPEALRQTPFIPFGIDTLSDVYSFGMLCWEMVTGREPYRGLSRSQIRVLVGYGGYRESKIQGGTLRGLPRLIEKCTSQESQERPTFERIVVVLNSMHSSANSAAEDALITFISGR